MVKWGRKVDMYAGRSFLFDTSDWVQYESLSAPIEANRGSNIKKDAFARLYNNVIAEIMKVEKASTLHLNQLKAGIDSDLDLVSLQPELSGVHLSQEPDNPTDKCWDVLTGLNSDKVAKVRIIAATILSYIQVNAEALRKLGKKIDKSLSLAHSSLEDTAEKEFITERMLIEELNERLGPVIGELVEIDLMMKRRERESPAKEIDVDVDTLKDESLQMRQMIERLSGNKVKVRFAGKEGGGSGDTDKEDSSPILDPLEREVKDSSFGRFITKVIRSSHVWLVLSFLFCLVVGFQPIFISITLQVHFNEATVVLAEAILSTFLAVTGAYTLLERGSEDMVALWHWPSILLMAPAGFLRAVEDVLTIVVMRFVDPLTYMVISQARLGLSALLSHFFLAKKPNLLEIQNVGVTTFGLVSYVLQGDTSSSSSSSSNNMAIGLLLLIVVILCKVTSSVWQDYAMKKQKETSIIVQTAHISMTTIPASIIFVIIIMMISESTDVLEGWRPILGVYVFYVFTKNFMSNLVIKRFSSVMKYVIYAAAMAVTYTFELALGYSVIKASIVTSLLIVSYGVFLYAWAGDTIETIVASTVNTIMQDDIVNNKNTGEIEGIDDFLNSSNHSSAMALTSIAESTGIDIDLELQSLPSTCSKKSGSETGDRATSPPSATINDGTGSLIRSVSRNQLKKMIDQQENNTSSSLSRRGTGS